jgi:hypothetical protein
MTPFEANFAKILTRFYLMMGVVLVAGFTGYWLLGLLALPIFLTAILGLGNKKVTVKTAKTQRINPFKKAKAA